MRRDFISQDTHVVGPITFKRTVYSDEYADVDWLGEPEWSFHKLEYPFYDRDNDVLVLRRFCLQATDDQVARYEELRELAQADWKAFSTTPLRKEYDALEPYYLGEYAYTVLRKVREHVWEYDVMSHEDIYSESGRRAARWIHKFQDPENPMMCFYSAERLDTYFDEHWYMQVYEVSASLTDDPEQVELAAVSLGGIESDIDDAGAEQFWGDLEQNAMDELRATAEARVTSELERWTARATALKDLSV